MSSDPKSLSEARLVKRWYATYFNTLVSFLHARFGAGPPEPEDIAQRTFSRLLESRSLAAISNPKAFLWRVAHNLAVSEHRKMQAAARGMEKLTTPDELNDGYLLIPERILEGREAIQVVIETLKRMPSRRREVLLLVRVEGFSLKEAAVRLGISSPAASKHLTRATTDLYDALIDSPVSGCGDV